MHTKPWRFWRDSDQEQGPWAQFRVHPVRTWTQKRVPRWCTAHWRDPEEKPRVGRIQSSGPGWIRCQEAQRWHRKRSQRWPWSKWEGQGRRRSSERGGSRSEAWDGGAADGGKKMGEYEGCGKWGRWRRTKHLPMRRRKWSDWRIPIWEAFFRLESTRRSSRCEIWRIVRWDLSLQSQRCKIV